MNLEKPIHATLIASLFVGGALAQTQAPPTILRDLNATPFDVLGSEPSEFTRLGSQVVFAATTAQDGRELWSLDPVTGAASVLRDIAPGAASSTPHTLVAFAGFVWFCADDGVHGRELWRTDGTPAGTELFVDLRASGSAFVSELTVTGNQLFFAAYVDGAGRELVVTDGTVTGTATLDVAAGPEHSSPSNLTALGNELWFAATTATTGVELWRSNGTPAGTNLAAEVVAGPEGSRPEQMQDLGGRVVFTTNGEVWSTDGTPASTSYVADGAFLSRIGPVAYFTSGASLYSTDGTATNTQLVTTLSVSTLVGINGLTALGSRMLIHVPGGFWGFPDITFASDGTAVGTVQLQQIVPTTVVVDGGLGWFASFDANTIGIPPFNGAQIWRTDGTTAGTTLAFQVSSTAVDGHPENLAILSGPTQVLFSAVDATGREPWIFDPTSNAGQQLANLGDDNGRTVAGRPYEIVDAAGTAYLAHTDPTPRLLRSDGTTSGTNEIVPPGPGQPSSARDLVTAGTRTFFRTYDLPDGYRLWASDGTAAGTVLIDLDNNTYPKDLVVAEDLLYFTCQDQFLRTNLWRTDGTQQGTFEAVPRPEFGDFSEIQPLGRGIVFGYQTYAMGAEPYYNDGTPGGTVMLGDLEPGANSSSPHDFVTLGERCFFVGRHGRLLVTDGTPSGTSEPLAGWSSVPTGIRNLFAARDRIWFTGSTSTSDVGLWTTDGTIAGTTLVTDLPVTPVIAYTLTYHQLGEDLLFELWVNGALALWHSDGTGPGTSHLYNGAIQSLVVTGEREAWFLGEDPAHGFELWRTDGTAAGTALFADLMPGAESSYPRHLALSGGRLFFGAEHPQLGNEPWTVQLQATSQDIGYGCTPTTSIPPSMWSDDPVRGTTANVHIAHGPAPGIGVAMISNYTTTTYPLGSGACDYFVDAGLVFLGYAVTAGGSATVPLAIPNKPTLDGLRFRMQALTIPVTGLLAAELSNGVTLTIGQ